MEQNIIKDAVVKGLKTEKIFKTDSAETILITLEKDALFPKHTSPKDAMLAVLEGSINFFIDGEEYLLKAHEVFNFSKGVEHYVTANENSKFLVIR